MTKEKKNEKKRDGLNGVLMQVAISIISIVFAFLVGGIIIAAMGENPFKAYSVLIKGAVGTSVALTVSLTKTVPLILTGLAVAVAQKSRVFNIGAEGQLLGGGLCRRLRRLHLSSAGASSHSALSGGRCACRHVLGVYCSVFKVYEKCSRSYRYDYVKLYCHFPGPVFRLRTV